MEIPKRYRPCKELADLYVGRDGNFIYRGKPKAVVRTISRHGKILTARIIIMQNGKKMYFVADNLVASAFVTGYKKGSYIEYKDGDIHNICADNLRIVTKKDYYAAPLP